MRIVRFSDEKNQECYGYDCRDGSAVLLTGHLFGKMEDSGRRVPVKKLLAPLQPPRFCASD